MADERYRQDRYRYDPDRYRERSGSWRGRDEGYGPRRSQGYSQGYDEGAGYRDHWREDDGYIARRGFGNRSAGYDPEDRFDTARERDFGDSAGYGSGGSARDWRDVVGDDRRRGLSGYGIDYGRDWDEHGYRSSYEDRDRYGSGFFGRGSRDYGEERGFLERAGDEIRSWFGDEEADRRRDMDVRRAEQHFRGRGPKGYQRSDERIREDVNDRLTDDPHIDASEIEVGVSNREVTLNGTVQSRFEKRHAEDIAESVSGVVHVQNNLRVRQGVESGGMGGLSSGTGTVGGTAGPGQEAGRRRTPSTSGT
ncbi:BON domain-containing protein [Microvirga thermotolerans]|uniref:BON domain-containing protein n=1 Tax=Microvirga thermotolerans TaxID=2651334 RepID=A0A5P9K036_9HYPH|nr:BON domain-containing protein [Microvirga thermotolerans]QFU17256.1 BON domain-containing protein [Microvirga thermotolerans]